MRGANRTAALAALADVAAVVVFVAFGRRSHDEANSVTGILGVAAPFLVGLVLGWALTRAARSPLAVTTGLAVWAVTVPAGMLLRRFAWDRSTAASFVIVAAIVLGALLVGWRAIANAIAARQHHPTTRHHRPTTPRG
ncbi:MAG: DUF3054 domain-containing protein [Actinomycetota bacterium]|nr:MAG: DUF3054 domain-containing protein [Actinomycetota bacterium]